MKIICPRHKILVKIPSLSDENSVRYLGKCLLFGLVSDTDCCPTRSDEVSDKCPCWTNVLESFWTADVGDIRTISCDSFWTFIVISFMTIKALDVKTLNYRNRSSKLTDMIHYSRLTSNHLPYDWYLLAIFNHETE